MRVLGPIQTETSDSFTDSLLAFSVSYSFSVAREWTDWADPDPYSALGLPPRRWDVNLLLDLVNLLEQLSSQSSRQLPKGD